MNNNYIFLIILKYHIFVFNLLKLKINIKDNKNFIKINN